MGKKQQLRRPVTTTRCIREVIGGLTQARVQLIAVRAIIDEEDQFAADRGTASDAPEQVARKNQLTMLDALIDGIGRIRAEYGSGTPEQHRTKDSSVPMNH